MMACWSSVNHGADRQTNSHFVSLGSGCPRIPPSSAHTGTGRPSAGAGACLAHTCSVSFPSSSTSTLLCIFVYLSRKKRPTGFTVFLFV